MQKHKKRKERKRKEGKNMSVNHLPVGPNRAKEAASQVVN